MFESITFVTPWLLAAGALAAAIPFVLHLLSSIRAQEVYYPTLRFLKLSMEKTARRRRIQHWLLLAVRSLMLAILAMAVAEPLLKLGKDWGGARNAASILVLDNSYSMATRGEQGVRLDLARTQARALLDDRNNRPAQAALLLTNATSNVPNLTGDIESLRKAIDTTAVGYGKAPIAARVQEALDKLAAESATPEKSIYVFSDLQRESFDELLKSAQSGNVLEAARQQGVHIFLVNTAEPRVVNVGLAELQVSGRRIADQPLKFNATVVNSSNENVRVHVDLRVDGRNISQRQTLTLPPLGKETPQFSMVFPQAGAYSGDVTVSIANDAEGTNQLLDQLEVDNRRHFALEVGGRVKTIIVRGASSDEGLGLDGVTYLKAALDGPKGMPWSIVPEIIEAPQLKGEALQEASMVILNEVESFSVDQAKLVTDFVAGGGSALFVLGPDCNLDNYNKVFIEDMKAQGTLLPAKVGPPQGEVGPAAAAEQAERLDLAHPFLAGLYPSAGDYPVVMANRYYKLEDYSEPSRAIMTLRSGSPLVVSRPFGKGLAVLCATTASHRWGNLSAGGGGTFMSMVFRMALESARGAQAASMFVSRSDVTIETGPLKADSGRPEETKIALSLPDGKVQPLAARLDQSQGYSAIFPQATAPGVYKWALDAAEGVSARQNNGAFAVNPDGSECNLAALGSDEMQRICENRKFTNVFVGGSLEEAQSRALQANQGRPWYDKLLPVVILLLVAEALIANRRKLTEDVIPAHLNPKVAQ